MKTRIVPSRRSSAALTTILLATTLLGGALPAAAQVPPSFATPDAPPGGDTGRAATTDPDFAPDPTGGGLAPMPTGPGTAPVFIDPATQQRIEKQSQGEYGPMERSLGVPLGATQDAWNTPFRTMPEGQVAPGVVRFNWSPELVMPIRIREFMITTIVLPDWEKVRDVYIGETVYLQAALIRDNAIGLRTGAAGIDTSITVVGVSGNLYTFYARAQSFNTKQLTDITVFVNAAPVDPGMWFRGSNVGGPATTAGQATPLAAPSAAPPASPGGWMPLPAAAGAAAPTATPAATPWSPGPPAATNGPGALPATIEGSGLYLPAKDLRFVHKLFEAGDGDRVIAPEWVATDGRWTYFHYGDRAGTVDRPAVYRIVDGVESIVNTRTIGAEGETLVAEAVGEFVLRSGRRVVCVKLAGAR